ncbi:hypothetical protein H6504_02500 [Candidatus Woesearchaeota archaeon]|nr:hypothetical protein [Candidatus Woesearchaeota archaeon]
MEDDELIKKSAKKYLAILHQILPNAKVNLIGEDEFQFAPTVQILVETDNVKNAYARLKSFGFTMSSEVTDECYATSEQYKVKCELHIIKK